MNPDSPIDPRFALESSLTALLLGELPHDQAAALHQQLAQDAELAKLYERLKHTINLVRETVASPAAQTAGQPTPLTLSDQRRQKLLQHFKTVAPKQFAPPRRSHTRWLVPVGIAAALVAVMAVALPPILTRFRLMNGIGASYDTMSVDAAPSLAFAPESSMEGQRNALTRSARHSAVKQSTQLDVEAKIPAELHARIDSVDSAIVLPKGSEVAGATTTTATEAVKPLSETTSLRGFYDDSLGRSGGQGGGGGFGGRGGGSGGGVRGDAMAAEGQQKGTAAVPDGFRVYSYGKSLTPPLVAGDTSHALDDNAAGRALVLGPDGKPLPSAPPSQHFVSRYAYLTLPESEKGAATSTGAGSTARQYPNNTTLGDAYFSIDPESRKAVVGSFNLQNAAPQDVQNNLQDLFGRNKLHEQNKDQDALVGQNIPQPTSGGITGGSGAGGSAVDGLEHGVPIAGVANAVDVPAMNKLSSARVQERVDQFGVNEPLTAASESPAATPPASPAPEPQEKSKLAWAGEAQAVPSNGYFGGRAYGGYLSSQEAPSGGHQGVAQSRPALRSPKEGDLAGRVDGAAVASAAPNPQDTGVSMGAFRRRFAGVPPAQKPAEDRTPLPGAIAPRQSDQKALGFDWYLGNVLMNNGPVPAQSGTAPGEVSQGLVQEKKSDQPPVPSEPVATPERLVPLELKLPAPAFKGTPKDVPLLGDVPIVGKLFRSRAAEGSVQANIYSQDVAGYNNMPLSATNAFVGLPTEPSTMERYPFYRQLSQLSTDANGASQVAGTPLVLPRTPETGLVLGDRAGKSVQLLASATQPGTSLGDMPKQAGEDAAKTLPYVEAKRELDQSQRSRQTLERSGAAKADQTNQADVAPSRPATPAPIPQPEVETAGNAFSTFSLNVSDVSFKLAAASLEKGVMPEPATVRSEEFINAFDYRDPEPPPGVPVAFAWERTQYPFAQNRDLLRFSIKTAAQGRQPGRALNLVLLLDNSGSMERADRVRIIQEALRVLAGQLQPQDLFSVVTFARTAHLWVDGVPGSQAAQVAEQVGGLTPQGGTNLEDAMDLAYQTALRHYLASGVNRVVLLTDGAANLGNVEPEALKQKVEAHRKQGVALDCFGIGWEGYNDDLLEVLARNGDGRYAFLNSPEEVASEFAAKLAGALQVAASDVKVQVEFNPARVAAYRQIGYAKHQLTKEQFRDNTVNAAQIGAAEAGNALYTVEVNPAGAGPLCTVRVRFRIPGTADYREHAWDVPFTGNALPLEQSTSAMRLAATASALSEWLASSPYAGEVTTDRLLGYLSGVPEVYGADARPKKLEWMIRQAKSIAGK